MRIRKPFTQEEKTIICSLYSLGHTPSDILRLVPSLSCRKVQTLYPVLEKAGLYCKKSSFDRRRFSVNDFYFDCIDNEHKAYWLGLLFADGFIVNSGHCKNTVGISLKYSDRYLLEVLKKDLGSSYEIHDYYSTGYSNTFYSKFSFVSSRIYSKFVDLGFKNKSSVGVLPVSFVPDYLVNHFIRGYFDGNGSLKKACGSHLFSLSFCGTLETIKIIKNILGKDNLKISCRFPDRNDKNYSVDICGDKEVYRICSWMYKDSTVFLKRKYNRFLCYKGKYQ